MIDHFYKNLAGMKKTVIGGYYREWNNNGLDSIPEQVKRMNILTTQIDKAAGIFSRIIMLGDMNLCSRKWNQDKFKDKRVKLVALSRNFGKEIALSAGVATGKYEAIIMLDGDGQHPVELIPEFISQWQSGSDVVIGLRKASSGRSALGRMNSYLFYKLTSMALPSAE